MAVNLDQPSIAAADTLGLFREYDRQHGHPTDGDSWARAVVSKIERDMRSPTSPKSSDLGPGENFTPEEWAAWEWYQKQTEPERWNILVSEYKPGALDPIDRPEELDPERAYFDKPNLTVDGLNQKPFDGEGGGPGAVAVSTDAILHFANVLESIAPTNGGAGPLWTVVNVVNDIDPRPGAFAKAELYRRILVRTPSSRGLSGETAGTATDFLAVLAAVQTDLRALVKEYDTTEELNSLTVGNFSDAMTRSNGRIDGLGSSATKEKE